MMVPAHRILPGVVAEIIRKAPLCPEKVEFAWRTAVGPSVSRITSVTLSESGVLIVDASDHHWAREIERSARLILARLENLLGPSVVTRIEARPSK